MPSLSPTLRPSSRAILPSTLPPSEHNTTARVMILALLLFGVAVCAYGIMHDMGPIGGEIPSVTTFVVLGLALLIAFGFEFANGFHDTANAVATVIYTHSLAPQTAVIWSGLWNFIGVIVSSGAVAYAVVSLLPVELMLETTRGAGHAMIFALLISAIIWNVGTWWFGLPASSSHTLIGSIVGVGLVSRFVPSPTPGPAHAAGLDWTQVRSVFDALLFSPVLGFIATALLLLVLRVAVRSPRLHQAPDGATPPLWIRGILVATCTAVSFAHGSNDGQKGMGLIMLILIGAVPTAYALNRALPPAHVQALATATRQLGDAFSEVPDASLGPVETARQQLRDAVMQRQVNHDDVRGMIAVIARNVVAEQAREAGTLTAVPGSALVAMRNDMYLLSEAIRILASSGTNFTTAEITAMQAYRAELDESTKFIPTWVKLAVAIALGLGTMVGWRRVVITVGEKIGKAHMTYAQGASAEFVAAATIGAADVYGLPVSTTHVLASGVAGAMAADRSGLQAGTVRNIVLAWVLTLPAAILLSGLLYWLFTRLGG